MAEIRRKQNSEFMAKTNERLLTERTSDLEKGFAETLKSLGYEQNQTIGKWTVDFLNKESKTIIEINGDYWHCNPKLYAEDFFNRSLNMTAQEKWLSDKARRNSLELLGHKVFVVWESEIKGLKIDIALIEKIIGK